MIKISFIIPVYNGEKTITESVKSISKWNFNEEIEILIVNDGSTDHTGDICKKLETDDNRITVFNIQNSGQGIARNYGIDHAKGKYISFVDADDSVEINQLKKLFDLAEKLELDIAYGSYKRIKNQKTDWIHLAGVGYMNKNGNKEEKKLYHLLKSESSFGYLWNKLYRKEFLDANSFRMDDIRKIYMEDLLFQLKIWTKNPVTYCVDYPIYSYNISNVSTTRKSDELIDQKNLSMLTNYIQFLKDEKQMAENLDILVPLICRVVCWSLVKNISYEGISFKKIKKRFETFVNNNEIQKVLSQKKVIRNVWKLPSKLQSLFYSVVLISMRKKWSCFIASIFCCMFPLMKIYIKKVLR